ncbi:hypothetical protein PM082_011888 [Marasmius tenuissimus]|nr:hypothetical protein PM082_011888 [Marasmius tenuissimus]
MPAEIRVPGYYKVVIKSALTPLKQQPNTQTHVQFGTGELRVVAISTLVSIDPRVIIPTLSEPEKTVIHHEKQAMPWVYQLNLPCLDESSDDDSMEIEYLYTK